MEELGIQHLARSAILVQPSFPDLALHLGFHCAHGFIPSGPYAGLFHQVIAHRQFAVEVALNAFRSPINFDV